MCDATKRLGNEKNVENRGKLKNESKSKKSIAKGREEGERRPSKNQQNIL